MFCLLHSALIGSWTRGGAVLGSLTPSKGGQWVSPPRRDQPEVELVSHRSRWWLVRKLSSLDCPGSPGVLDVCQRHVPRPRAQVAVLRKHRVLDLDVLNRIDLEPMRPPHLVSEDWQPRSDKPGSNSHSVTLQSGTRHCDRRPSWHNGFFCSA